MHEKCVMVIISFTGFLLCSVGAVLLLYSEDVLILILV